VILPREATETDDSVFTDILYAVVDGIVAQLQPKELYVTATDSWFDHKWLRFSGIGAVPFEFPAFMNRADAALDEFRQGHAPCLFAEQDNSSKLFSKGRQKIRSCQTRTTHASPQEAM
jgi:hypothetical protein